MLHCKSKDRKVKTHPNIKALQSSAPGLFLLGAVNRENDYQYVLPWYSDQYII